MTNPKGSCVLWLRLPGQYDVIELFHSALDAGSALHRAQYLALPINTVNVCPELWYSLSDKVEVAVARLGALCQQVQGIIPTI